MTLRASAPLREPLTPAQAALAQFRQRQRWPVPDHEAKLRPWAAIALRAGADLALLPDDLRLAHANYRRAGLSDAHARSCVADDLCPWPDVLAELARARDAALDASLPLPSGGVSGAKFAAGGEGATRQLVTLAIYLGAPPYHPSPRAPIRGRAQLEPA